MNKYFITFLFAIVSCTISAQVNVNSKQLAGTTWKIIKPYDNSMEHRWSFSNKECRSFFIFRSKKSSELIKTYYLSQKDEQFQHSKVGTATSGCYLCYYNTKLKESSNWLITYFDSQKGILKVKGETRAQPGEILLGGETVTLTLQRISPE